MAGVAKMQSNGSARATHHGNPVEQAPKLYQPIGQTRTNQATIVLVFSDSRPVALTTFSRSISIIEWNGNSAIVAEELNGQRPARPEFG